MPAPAFVGVGPVTSSTSPPWPTSLTITSGKQPSGISVGDRVILVVAMCGPEPGSGLSSVHHFSVSNAAWTATSPASSTQPTTTPHRVGVHTFTARWDPSLLPVTLSPCDSANNVIGPSSGSNIWWKCYLAAWSPSATPSTGQDRTASGGSWLPKTAAPWATGTFANDGTAVAFGVASFDLWGGATNGFTVRALLTDPPRWNNALPNWHDTIIADKAFSAGGSSAGPHFDTSNGVHGGALLFRLDTPDAPIVTDGWSVGMIQW